MKSIITLVAAAALIGILTMYFFYSSYFLDSVIVLETEVKVDSSLGLNADDDALRFGKLIPGTTGVRNVDLKNTEMHPVKVHISLSGVNKDWIEISANDFTLQPSENQSVSFTATPPIGTPYGTYTGEATVTFRRLLFR